MREYRIVTDTYAGFECQTRSIWTFGSWVQLRGTNTHKSKEEALSYIGYIVMNHKEIIKKINI